MNNKYKFLFAFSLSFCLTSTSAFPQDIPTIPDVDFVVPEKRDFQLNTKISPCNDFYKYTCSEEISKFKLPESKSRYVFSFNDSSERIKKQRLEYIKSLSNMNNINPKNEMVRNYYKSCMDTDSRKNEEISLIRDYKVEISGLSKEKILEKFALESLSGDAHLINIEEMENNNNSKVKDILFSYQLPLKVKEYYSNEALLADYKNLIKEFFDNISVSDSASKSDFIVNFEKELANIYPTKAEMRDIITRDNTVTRKFLLLKYRNLHFKTMLDKIPSSVNINLIPNAKFDKNSVDLFAKMNSTLGDASVSDLQALALWNKFSLNTIKYSYPDFYLKTKDFKNKYNGISKIEESLEFQCTQSTAAALERNLDFEIVNAVYKDFPTKRVKNIVEQIQKTTLENIKNNTWLSKEAKQKAELKIQKIRFQIVKPDKIADWDLENETSLSSKKYLNNQKIIIENKFKKTLKDITKPVNDNLWQMSPLTVNAYYNPRANQFVMPMGILQPPFFDESKSDVTNFGSVGMVVAHEIGHSIDDQGSKYDETGKLNQWMNADDLNNFKQKTQKIITLFDKDGADGKLTLGENIADFAGLQNSFQSAFSNKSQDNIEQQKEFFIQYAKTWCGVIQPKNREYMLKTDPHAPTDLRVNTQMKLSKQFEETFSCKQGDAMTIPDSERITLW